MAAEIVEEYQHAAVAVEVMLTFTTADEMLFVNADPIRLRQVISNLLGNALKSVSAGGRVAVTVEQQGEHAVLRVADDGCGIPADELAMIFTHFSQGSNAAGSLGLGLALVKGIVELHGGTVGVDSPGPGHGSIFTVELPLLPGPADLPHEPAVARDGAPASLPG